MYMEKINKLLSTKKYSQIFQYLFMDTDNVYTKDNLNKTFDFK